MKIVYFVHAVASCWNNGNAHFLRGVGTELKVRGHDVVFCEPQNGWSETNLIADHGTGALTGFQRAYPGVKPKKYNPENPELDRLTDGADLVIAHEWNETALINALGGMRRRGAPFVLLFHDTHHRAVTQPGCMAKYQLADYDGVLAFGEVLAELYRRRGWAKRVRAWHEAADTAMFYPRPPSAQDGDVVWIGNWGDEERSAELGAFLFEPVEALRLSVNIYGVRYPQTAIAALIARGISYRGWLANHMAPEVFGRHRATVHVPRRPYAEALRGIPTIRIFEALACGIPLISAPWPDVEGLFPRDCYLTARNGEQMSRAITDVLHDRDLAHELVRNGLNAIAQRHTCAHRVRELLAILAALKLRRQRERHAPLNVGATAP